MEKRKRKMGGGGRGKKGKQSFCLFLAGGGGENLWWVLACRSSRWLDVLIKTDEPPGGLMTPVESASDYRYNVPLESIGILFLIAYRPRMFSSLLLN